MNPTDELIEAVKKNDVARARDVLGRHPEAARGRGSQGESPVLLAAYFRAEAILALLREHTTLDIFEATAVADLGRVREVLAASPAQVHERSFDGWTALHLAGFFGHVAIASALLEAGAKLDARSKNREANEPLHAAIAGKGDPAVVKLLLERGAGVNAKGAGGYTPLHLAASRGSVEVAEMLLSRGAGLGARSEDGKTASEIAVARGHEGLGERLRG